MNQVWRILSVALTLLAMALPAASGVQAAPRTGKMQAPAGPAATVTFAIIGDYGMDDANEQAVANLVAGWSPDFVIASGDDYYNAAGNESGNKYHESTGKYYCNFLKDVAGVAPCATGNAATNKFFPVLGNHDYSDAGTTGGQPQTYTDYFALPGSSFTNTSGNERYYDFVNGPVHFFMINSNSAEPDGTNGVTTPLSVQAQWLKDQLDTSSSPWNVVVFHHPPYASDTNHGSNAYMQWPFAAWGADVVISGHSHVYERIERDGIVYFVNGVGGAAKYGKSTTMVTGSKFFWGLADPGWGAQKVVATDTTLDFQFYTTDGTLRDSSHLPQAAQSCTTVSASVAASSDDAEESRVPYNTNATIGKMYVNSTDLELIDDPDVNTGMGQQIVGMRFSGLAIPQGSIIQNAHITWQAKEAQSATTDLTFHAEAVDNAATYTEAAANISSRAKTTASVTWSGVPAWTVDASYQSADLSTIVQAVVNRTGWSNGNALNVIVEGTVGSHRTPWSWDGTGTEPNLTVTYCQPADIGDQVWNDVDGDGIQVAGEPGIAGVTVNLRNSSTNALAQTTTTSAAGVYGFSGVPTGNYYVEFILPPTYRFGPKYATGATTPTSSINDSDANLTTGRTDAFAWTSGGTSITAVDAGMLTSCATVEIQSGIDNWMDNANSTTNNGTDVQLVVDGSPISGALIRWDVSAIPAGRIIQSASITYHLNNNNDQSANAYQIYGVRRDWTEVGSSWNNWASGSPWTTPGAQNTTNDRFSTVLGLTPTGGTPPVDLPTTLNASGLQLIQNWVNGITPNYGVTIQNYGNTDGFRFSSFNSATVANRPKLTVTYCQPNDIGDFVWADTNKNGIQDAGEPGANGVTVTLWNVGGDGQVGGGDDVLVGTTQTIAGRYGFSGLTNGVTYYLAFTKPAGNSFSPQNVGADSTDSDGDPNTGRTAPFVWTAATQDIDAGLHSGPQCFAISDSTDTLKNENAVDSLIQFDILTGIGTYIGTTTNATNGNAVNLESATWNPFDGKLFSVEDIQANTDAYLVTINTATGAYTRVGGPLGQCLLRLRDGTSGGNLTISDVDGLGIDFTTGKMYGIIRRSGPDALFQIDPATGLNTPNAFPGGWGCVEIANPSGNASLTDIDDIGFNPAGVLYGAANAGQTETRIVRINEANGDSVDLGPVYFGGVPLTDIEGFSFDATGRAIVTTGQDGNDGNDDAAYELNITVNPIVATRRLGYFGGAGTLVNALPSASYEDYEGLTCYGVPLQNMTRSGIGNYVWVDVNNDGHQDAGEGGIPNVAVQLWVPGNDGVFATADDELFATANTNAQGGYLFDNLLAGPYEVRIPAPNFGTGGALEGMMQSTHPVNGGADLGNQSLPYQIMLPFSTQNLTADFGFWPPMDFGDLPNTYKTLRSDNGPRHTLTPNLYLGACVDVEGDGQPTSPTPAGGDNNNAGDPYSGTCDPRFGDEDGVARNMSDKWEPGAEVHLAVTVVGEGELACWIDWNGDGNFGDGVAGDAEEFIPVTNVGVVNLTIPSSYMLGRTLFTRCRLFPTGEAPGGGSPDQGDYIGFAPGGEVEDYMWTFGATAVTLRDLQATTLSTGELLAELLRSWLHR